MRALKALLICSFLLTTVSLSYAVTYDHASKLNVALKITDLGGGNYKYEFSFTNAESDSIWHFLVWTKGAGTSTKGSFPHYDDGHSIPVGSSANYNTHGTDPVIKE